MNNSIFYRKRELDNEMKYTWFEYVRSGNLSSMKIPRVRFPEIVNIREIVDISGTEDKTALQILSEEELYISEFRKDEIFKHLLLWGADPNIRFIDGRSLLYHYIVTLPDTYISEILLKYGAIIDIENEYDLEILNCFLCDNFYTNPVWNKIFRMIIINISKSDIKKILEIFRDKVNKNISMLYSIVE